MKTSLHLPGKITDASFAAIAEHAMLKARLERIVVGCRLWVVCCLLPVAYSLFVVGCCCCCCCCGSILCQCMQMSVLQPQTCLTWRP